jgi:16S rRNA (cytosine967-C5)-methyltransferase
VQDEASALCVAAMDAKEGDLVLDACACPGGKSFGMAMAMKNQGKIFARDLHKNKLSLIETGAEKLGISIIETGVQNASVHNPEMPAFDKILCDVPCSGLGQLRKRPYFKLKNEKDLKDLPEIQYKILENSAKMLKSGGTLVYSTCTLREDENERVVSRFVENNDFEILPITPEFENFICKKGMITVIPNGKYEGFLVAKLIKKG